MKRKGFFVRQEWVDALVMWMTKDGKVVEDAKDRMVLIIGALIKIAMYANGENPDLGGEMDDTDVIFNVIKPQIGMDLQELRDLDFIE